MSDHVSKPIDDPEKAPNTAIGVPMQNEVHSHYEWSSEDRNQWSTGVCGCTEDVPNCIDVMLCQPCHIALQYNSVLYNKNSINWGLLATILCCDGLTRGATSIITRGFPMYFVRKALRDRYHLSNLEGTSDGNGHVVFDEPKDMWADVCLVLWCTPCVVCQHHREMTMRGEWPGKILFGSNSNQVVLEAPTTATAV